MQVEMDSPNNLLPLPLKYMMQWNQYIDFIPSFATLPIEVVSASHGCTLMFNCFSVCVILCTHIVVFYMYVLFSYLATTSINALTYLLTYYLSPLWFAVEEREQLSTKNSFEKLAVLCAVTDLQRRRRAVRAGDDRARRRFDVIRSWSQGSCPFRH